MSNRPLLALALSLLAGCGGKTLGSFDGGPGGGDGGVFTAPDGAACVDIDLSTYDQSCDQVSDCAQIASGVVCASECFCPSGSAINTSDLPRYRSQLAQLPVDNHLCSCGAAPLGCVDHVCTVCSDLHGPCGSGASDGGTTVTEASAGPETGTSGDGAACVHIDPTSFDQSCNTKSDCIGITGGTICSGGCACGGATINKSGEATYEADLSGLTLEGCPCVSEGQPECVGGTCTLCGFGTANPPGCPDGG